MMNRVVFVSRKYGGTRMGSDRFECYLQAAKATIIANPKNTVLDCNQSIKETTANQDPSRPIARNKQESPSKNLPHKNDQKKDVQENSKPDSKKPHYRPRRNPRGQGRASYSGGYDRKRAAYDYFVRSREPRYSEYERSGRNLVSERTPPSHSGQEDFNYEWDYQNDWSSPADRHYYQTQRWRNHNDID